MRRQRGSGRATTTSSSSATTRSQPTPPSLETTKEKHARLIRFSSTADDRLEELMALSGCSGTYVVDALFRRGELRELLRIIDRAKLADGEERWSQSVGLSSSEKTGG